MTNRGQPISFKEFCSRLGVPDCCITNHTSVEQNNRTFNIQKQRGDQVWCIKVDRCWLGNQDGKRVDYLFWCQSASGQKNIFLVELKGENFGDALDQIKAILERLCKKAGENIVHKRNDYRSSPGHDLSRDGGVKAFVVLSQGGNVQYNQLKAKKIQESFNVVVYPKCVRKDVTLPR